MDTLMCDWLLLCALQAFHWPRLKRTDWASSSCVNVTPARLVRPSSTWLPPTPPPSPWQTLCSRPLFQRWEFKLGIVHEYWSTRTLCLLRPSFWIPYCRLQVDLLCHTCKCRWRSLLHIHGCAKMLVYVYACMHASKCVYTCMWVCMRMHVCTHTHTHTHTLSVPLFSLARSLTHSLTHTFTYMYTHTHTHTHTHTCVRTHAHTQSHTNTWIHTYTYRPAYLHIDAGASIIVKSMALCVVAVIPADAAVALRYPHSRHEHRQPHTGHHRQQPTEGVWQPTCFLFFLYWCAVRLL